MNAAKKRIARKLTKSQRSALLDALRCGSISTSRGVLRSTLSALADRNLVTVHPSRHQGDLDAQLTPFGREIASAI